MTARKRNVTRARAAARVAAVKVKLTFTAEETALVGRAAQRVWSDIAHDLLADTEADGAGLGTMDRAGVIEVVADAGRLEEALRRESKWGKVGGPSRDLVTRVAALGAEEIVQLLTPAFPHEEYGL